MIVLGIVIAASLVVALVGTVTTTNSGATVGPTPASSDPSQLIRAATANPNDGDSIGALADYYNQTGQQQQALALYQKYVALRPSDARARVTLAEILIGSGNLPGAQSQLVQAITFASAGTDPQTTARAHLDLGDVYTGLQPPRQNDALAEYKQAADLDQSGNIGDEARTKLAALQVQLNLPTVTVIAPGVPASDPPVRRPPARAGRRSAVDQPRRLLHIVQRYAPYEGGSENYVRELSERFAADGHTVTVLTTDAWDLEYFWHSAARRVDAPPEEMLNGVRVLRFPVRHYPASSFGYRALRRAMAEWSRLPAVPGREAILRRGGRFAPWVPALHAWARAHATEFDLDTRRQHLDRIDRARGRGSVAAGAYPARRHTLRPSRRAG